MTADFAPREMRGSAPVGMPLPVEKTLQVVRDAIYLAAHDSQWAVQELVWLRDMLTAFASSCQIEILRRGDWPAAFLCWAHLTRDAQNRLIADGVSALTPSDVAGGEQTWLIGIASPWRHEDFDMMMAWAARNLMDGAGGWKILLPALDGLPHRVME